MKNFVKMFGIIAFVAVIGFSMVACDFGNDTNSDDPNSGDNSSNGNGGGSTNPTIKIQNNTGYTLDNPTTDKGLYIKLSNSSDWGSPITGYTRYTINNTESRVFTLPARISNNNVYDIQWRNSSATFTKYAVSLTFGMTLTFTQGDYDDGSQNKSFTIKNLSGVDFNSSYIKPSSASDWGINFGSISSNGSRIITLPFSPNYNEFDIQVRSSNPANTYTRNSISISNGIIVNIYPTDSDNPGIINPVILIQNNTGYTLDNPTTDKGLYIKLSNSSDWGSPITGYTRYTINNTESRVFTLPVRISNNNVYDIQWRNSSATFTKYAVSLTFGMTLTFNSSDLEQ